MNNKGRGGAVIPRRISEKVSEENLLNYAKSIDIALKAIENAAFFGHSDYVPQLLTEYGYKD